MMRSGQPHRLRLLGVALGLVGMAIVAFFSARTVVASDPSPRQPGQAAHVALDCGSLLAPRHINASNSAGDAARNLRCQNERALQRAGALIALGGSLGVLTLAALLAKLSRPWLLIAGLASLAAMAIGVVTDAIG